MGAGKRKKATPLREKNGPEKEIEMAIDFPVEKKQATESAPKAADAPALKEGLVEDKDDDKEEGDQKDKLQAQTEVCFPPPGVCPSHPGFCSCFVFI